MSDERRRYPRLPTNISAQLETEAGSRYPGRLRDFCRGGGLLILPAEAVRVARGDVVRLGIGATEGVDTLELRAWVAHVGGHSLGLAFIGAEPAQLDRLEQLATAAEAWVERQRITGVNDHAAALGPLVARSAERLARGFPGAAAGQLQQALVQCVDAKERDAYALAGAALRRYGGRLAEVLAQRIADADKGAAVARSGEGSGGLSLVDKADFEQWLVLRTASLRLEEEHAELLAEVDRLLAGAQGGSPDGVTNPLGPERVCRLFEATVNEAPIDPVARNRLKAAFADYLRERLPGEIRTLIKGLRERGIEEAADEVVRSASSLGAGRRADEDPASDAGRELSAPVEQLMQRVEHLIDSLSALEAQPGQRQDTEAREIPSEARLAALLERLDQHIGDGGKLWEEAGLTPDQGRLVGGVEELLGGMRRSTTAKGDLTAWLAQLRPVMARSALREQGLNGSEGHLLLRIVDLLERLATPAGVPAPAEGEVAQLLQRIREGGEPAYREAVARLEGLVAESQRPFEHAVARWRQRTPAPRVDGKLSREVDFLLSERLRDADIPLALRQFVSSHWREVLRETARRHDREGQEWREAIATLDELLALSATATESNARPRITALARRLDRGLRLTPLRDERRRELVRHIALYLYYRDFAGQEALDTAVYASRDEVRLDSPVSQRPPELSPRIWNDSLARVRVLEPGTWLAMSERDGRAEPYRLLSVDEAAGVYLLASADGERTLELGEGELAHGFADGRIEVIGSNTLPLRERVTYDLLSSTHQQLTESACRDPLTGLANRRELERLLKLRLRDAVQRRHRHTLCYFDVDLMRIFNHTYGHDVGDSLLKAVGRALQEQCGDYAEVARVGSDEFALLFTEMPLKRGLRRAEALLERLREIRVHTDGGEEVGLTVSMGVLEISPATESVNQVFATADAACDSARDEGGDRLRLYQGENEQLNHRHELMNYASRIGRIVKEGQLFLRCQQIAPIGSDPAMRPHYEVLLGLSEAAGGQGKLGTFITAAEMYGRMAEVDRWVVHNTFRWMCDHPSVLERLGGLSINLSGNSFRDDRFLKFLLAEMKYTAVPAEKIIFEVTETVAVGSLRTAATLMRTIKEQGCRFALDDFGSGLSSYSYLKSLPVDYLKIDGIFVRNLIEDPNDLAVVRSINELGHFMGKRTIAEFVASEAILTRLRELGVDYAQGFHMEKPMPLEALSG